MKRAFVTFFVILIVGYISLDVGYQVLKQPEFGILVSVSVAGALVVFFNGKGTGQR